MEGVPQEVSASLALGSSEMRSCLALRSLLRLEQSLAYTWTGLGEGRRPWLERGCQVSGHATEELESEPRTGTLQSPCKAHAALWVAGELLPAFKRLHESLHCGHMLSGCCVKAQRWAHISIAQPPQGLSALSYR